MHPTLHALMGGSGSPIYCPLSAAARKGEEPTCICMPKVQQSCECNPCQAWGPQVQTNKKQSIVHSLDATGCQQGSNPHAQSATGTATSVSIRTGLNTFCTRTLQKRAQHCTLCKPAGQASTHASMHAYREPCAWCMRWLPHHGRHAMPVHRNRQL
jgi:hypothetical protein